MKYSVVLLCYRGLDFVIPTLEALLANTRVAPDEYELIVVENDSPYVGTRQYLYDMHQRGHIDWLLLAGENQGTSRGFNAGFKVARASDKLVRLEDDILVPPGWLTQMSAIMDDIPKCAILAAELYPEGLPEQKFLAEASINGHDVYMSTGTVGGGCLVIGRKVFQKYGYFPHQGDRVMGPGWSGLLQRKVEKDGQRVLYTREVRAEHFGAQGDPLYLEWRVKYQKGDLADDVTFDVYQAQMRQLREEDMA